MKILFLGYKNSPLISFLRRDGNTVSVVSEDEKITPELVRRRRHDFLVSYGYKHILRRDILCLFPGRAINLHPSYLPWNRGTHQNFWCHFEGTPSGVTIHHIDEGVDTGDIIIQKKVSFEDGDTLRASYEKLHRELQELFTKHWVLIKAGLATRQKQRGKGTRHFKKDLEQFKHLLHPDGWDTSIARIREAGEVHKKMRRS